MDALHHLPLPPRTHRKVGTPDFKWGRFLFRRHIQHTLKWTARREEGDPSGFGEWLNSLIREKLFPEPKRVITDGEDEGSGEGKREAIPSTGGGGASLCPESAATEALVQGSHAGTEHIALEEVEARSPAPTHHVAVMGSAPPYGSQELGVEEL